LRIARSTLQVALVAALGLAVGAATSEPACHAVRFEGDGFVVCRYRAGRDALRLLNAPAPDGEGFATVKARLGAGAARVRFAMNAGMYDPDRRPVGLFVADGVVRHPLNRASGGGNFFLKPNGVFWTDGGGRPHVQTTDAFAAEDAHPRWATQSGPMLVIHGALHPAILPNGTSLAVRNGVGVDGDEALFAISDGPVSFGRFARLFRDALGCPEALYLDGSVSSAWIPVVGRMDGRSDLGTFIVVLRGASAPR
jgi:uncharacterized protein YigE (DUF2233 family)